jgi:hypothetical protein
MLVQVTFSKDSASQSSDVVMNANQKKIFWKPLAFVV